MNLLISVVFAFRDFCLFVIVVFFEVPLVLSFQGKNEKKNFIPDILYRCQPDKLKFKNTDIIFQKGAGAPFIIIRLFQRFLPHRQR